MDETTTAEQVGQMDAMLRSHVERCLQDAWECDDLVVDSDGEYPYRHGTAACYVRPDGAPQPGVTVYAFAVMEVRRRAALLAEINEINGRTRFTRIYWDADTVAVEAQIPWTAIDRPTLDFYTARVASVADEIGGMIAAVFGGQTPFPAADEDETLDAGDEEDVA